MRVALKYETMWRDGNGCCLISVKLELTMKGSL
jgi:hypothetical protein